MSGKPGTPKSKKRTKRSKKKYPALSKDVNLKSRIDLIDYDYLDKLSPEEKAWLNNFTEEEINANLTHKGKKFNKSAADKKKIYDSNNARNRCIYTQKKASGQLIYLSHVTVYNEDDTEQENMSDRPLGEDELNSLIDSLKNFKKTDGNTND